LSIISKASLLYRASCVVDKKAIQLREMRDLMQQLLKIIEADV
jgi:hypothetical protein